MLIMIGREITMSALREWAAASGGAAHRAVKVNTLGKYKTALQARERACADCIMFFDSMLMRSHPTRANAALGNPWPQQTRLRSADAAALAHVPAVCEIMHSMESAGDLCERGA